MLREAGIASMVQNALLFFDAQRYRLLAWVVMPNHVHAMFQPMSGCTVAKIVSSWKKFAASRICALLKQRRPITLPIGVQLSPVWHREYWDRFIRDNRHFERAMAYIHQNSVKAGLVERVEDWRWGSARIVAEREDPTPAG